MTNNSGKP